jgi:hypothetical protein
LEADVTRLAFVLAVAIIYPVVVLAGGSPHFPSRSECVNTATKDGDIEAVFGRFESRAAADAQVKRVVGLGFKGAEPERDACGRVKVVVHGITTIAVGRELAGEAHRVGLDVTLEYAPAP